MYGIMHVRIEAQQFLLREMISHIFRQFSTIFSEIYHSVRGKIAQNLTECMATVFVLHVIYNCLSRATQKR